MSFGITETTFDLTLLSMNVAYVAVVVGIINQKPDYLVVIDFWLKVFMGVFLVVRFNPFTSVKFTEFDRKVVFATGVFLLVITVVNNYLASYVEKLKTDVRTLLGTN